MNPLFILITVTALLLAFAVRLVLRRHRAVAGLAFFANALIVNVTPKGRATRQADAAFTARYLLAKPGSDAWHIAICTAADVPLGVVPDMTGADGDLTYPLPVNFLGLNEDTERMIASAAIVVGAYVVPAAGGKIKTLPTAGGGTTAIIGRAVTAAGADGDQIEIIPCFPIPTTIAA